MSEPKSLDEIVGESLARMRAWQDTPEGRAHLEHAARLAEERRRRDLEELADIRGLVADADVRNCAFDPSLTGVFVDAVRRALAWRAQRMRALRGKCPLVLWLSSPPGLGKTVALSHAVVHAARSAWFVTAAEVGATVRNGHSEPEAKWRQWERAELIAVDEAGLEDRPEQITQLALARWSMGGVTLIGTNLARRQIDARHFGGPLGERLADRLVHTQQRHGQDWCVMTQGRSLRAGVTR